MTPRLADFPAFAEWPAEELIALEGHLSLSSVAKGHVFVHEGTRDANELKLFALVKGEALVTRGGASFTLEPGALFGVVAFVDGGARSATVSAGTDAEVLALTREAHATLEPRLAARLELVIARQLARDFAAMNRRAVEAFAAEVPAPAHGPRLATLHSYSGTHLVRTEVHEASSVREVMATLAAARKQGRRLVLRGAGLSFDSQALYGDLTLQLKGFTDITVNREAKTVTAGACARWGDVLTAVEAHGLVPTAVVSGSDITLGGSLSINALSRFSPLFGKEGKSIESLDVLTVSGERLTVSRTHEPDLFYAAIGGFGQVAVVLGVTHRLLSVGTPVRVESRVQRTPHPEELAPALLCAPSSDPHAQTSYAVVAFKGDETRSIITRSRYVNDVPLKTLLPHRPANVSRVPIELAIHHFQTMGQAFWNFAYERYLDDAAVYVDELAGYTFFMDGNVRTRRASEALGLGFHTVQQTYLVPQPQQLAPFIARARAMTRAAKLELALVDVLYLSEDERFCLSSTNGASGYAVTFTFEGLDDVSAMGRVRELFVDLTTDVAALGGRVHLTKNVFTRPGELNRMYRAGLEQLVAARKKYDPTGLLTSDFVQRLFPELTAR